MNKPIPKELMDELEKLEPDDQGRVLEYAQSLRPKSESTSPGSIMRKFVGTISKSDLEIMKRAADEDCSQIDHASWK